VDAIASSGGVLYIALTQPAKSVVMRVPLDGGLPVTVAAQDAPEGGRAESFVAADGGSLYWAVGSGGVTQIVRMSPDGTDHVTFAVTKPGVHALAVDATDVYWITSHEQETLFRVSKDGGTPLSVMSASSFPADPFTYPVGLAADAGRVFVNVTSIYPLGHSERIVTLPKAGGPIRAVSSAVGDAFAFALDGTSQYGFRGDSVVKQSRASDTPTWIAYRQIRATGIAVDATSVYWTVDDEEDGPETERERSVMKATPK
jgi:hypothetical protein